ncbi:DNA adenine methylase [Candidatus Eisenbacteria bacterium]|uniref:site-specific DNA-methyltransferase (adenine-specific) n=1 Tax=Eiseniibacteriota bacterium TaxID=2212470 RepID=A0ABV6YLK2_UNCEI
MRRARSRKLALWDALPAYLGGKRRLCPTIFREIDAVIPRRHWSGLTFLDGFSGGGAVSLFARAQGFSVVSADIAERAVVVGRALIENSRVTLTHEDILRIAAPNADPPGTVERTFAPGAFTRAQARLLDRTLAMAAETRDVHKSALLRLLVIRLALAAHPMSQVRSGNMGRLAEGQIDSITQSCLKNYVTGLRLTRVDRLWDFAQRINGGVFEGTARVLKASVLDVLPHTAADVAYFDPPYPATTSYEREYEIIDQILEGKRLPVSPFSRRDGAALLDKVFAQARHVPVWVLSLGNATVSKEELESKMRSFGREVKSTEVRYAHKVSVASKEKTKANREFVITGWDPAAPLSKAIPGRTLEGVK